MDATIALNKTECIRRVVQFGQHKYVDLCTGQSVYLPWGIDDWMLFSLLFILISVLAAVPLFLIIGGIRDW